MYRDDDTARVERASSLINEIAELERQKVVHATTDQRLEAARLELRGLQSNAAETERTPGVVTHLVVFTLTAAVAFVGYALLS